MNWMQRVKTFLESNVSFDDRLLLAVSGGADSMGMLSLQHEDFGICANRIVIGHVQHGIRTAEDEDLDLIRSWADSHNVLVLSHRVNARALASAERSSLEAAARQLRYRALEEMCAKSGCRWMLTAHTLDDSVETIWMRMSNGGMWHEWTGIPARRGRILRPLIGVSRGELREWVEIQRITFSDDVTNFDHRFRRNLMRHQMASRPDIWNDQRKQELALAGDATLKLIKFQKRLARVLPLRVFERVKPRVIGLAIDRIFIYFKDLKFVPVEAAWADLKGEPNDRLPASVRRQVTEFIAGSRPESQLMLPSEIRMIRRDSIVWLTAEHPCRIDESVGHGRWWFPTFGATLSVGLTEDGTGERLSPELGARHMRVRTWQSGDRLKLARRPRKKISDLLNEASLDPVARENTLVLVDEEGPLMILGGPVDERALAKATEKNPLIVTWNTND